MERKSKLCVFPYLAIDYKAAEAWLNQQAAQGWAFQKLVWPYCLARMVPTARQDLRYCVDLTSRKEARDQEYLDLCREAGWTEAANRINVYRIFQSREGCDPAPLQTEPGIELRRFLRKRLAKDILSILALPLIFLFFYGLLYLLFSRNWAYYWPVFQLDFATSAIDFFWCAMFVLDLPLAVWQIVSALRDHRRARRAASTGAPFPVPAQKEARRRGWPMVCNGLLYALFLLCIIVANLSSLFTSEIRPIASLPRYQSQPLLLLEDVGLPPSNSGTFLYNSQASPLMRNTMLEIPGDTILYTDHYACLTVGLAEWTAEKLMEKYTAAGTSFTPVELGFDESWQELGGSLLLLRQGKNTVLLSGAADWTDPDILGVLWERLQLKE